MRLRMRVFQWAGCGEREKRRKWEWLYQALDCPAWSDHAGMWGFQSYPTSLSLRKCCFVNSSSEGSFLVKHLGVPVPFWIIGSRNGGCPGTCRREFGEVLGFLWVSCSPTPAPCWVSMTTLHFRSFSWFFLKSAWHFLSTVLGTFLITYFLEKHLFHTFKYSCFIIFLWVFLFLGVLIVLLAVYLLFPLCELFPWIMTLFSLEHCFSPPGISHSMNVGVPPQGSYAFPSAGFFSHRTGRGQQFILIA